MKKAHLIALLLAFFTVVEAVSAPPALQNDESLRQMAVGIWSAKLSFGPATMTGYTQVCADGTYSNTMKASALGLTKWMHEEGTWSIEKGAMNTVVLLSENPKAKPTARSEILEMDSKKWAFMSKINNKSERREKIKVAVIPEEFIKRIAELKKDLKRPKTAEPTAINPSPSAKP